MDPVDLILIGCGLMGARHLRGYAELERVRPGSLRLRAVCDPLPQAAQAVAAETERLLGYRPRVCGSAAEALELESGIVAADVVTDPLSHLAVVLPLLQAGLHVQVEKPLSITVADGRAMADTAAACVRILAVAENYRRDPMNRLLRHVIRSGAIGTPQFGLETHLASGRRVLVSPWRHAWAQGGLALDMGVHYADILEYLLGPVDRVSAQMMKARELREWSAPNGEVCSARVECDDVYSALISFRSGAQGVWLMHFGTAGEHDWRRSVHGTEGGVEGPPDRSGSPVRLHRDGATLEGDSLVAALPEFHLTGVEAALFGERPGSYRLEFPATDRALIAVETADFLDAVRDGRPPEVTAEDGLRSVALVIAVLESAHTGTAVAVEDVFTGAVQAFQQRLC
jgi:predicted dehydrogenase